MHPATASPPGVIAPVGGWAAALRQVLADPGCPRLVFQPIVDLRHGVVAGYEALARFDLPTPDLAPADLARADEGVRVPPDVWFAMADQLGLGAELEARVVAAALVARDRLPADCFLSVNVSPHLLTEPALADLLLGAGDLNGLVLELTEHVAVEDDRRLVVLLEQLRAAGAAIALDDAGSGYSGLQQLALLRPQLVKLDRTLVDHADRDEAKLALAELLGAYAGRLDAWLLVEGIERVEELEAFVRLGVPLAQGFLLARPGPGWPTLAPEMAIRLRAMSDRVRRVHQVAGLVEAVPSVLAGDPAGAGVAAARAVLEADPGLDLVAVVDDAGTPLHLVRPALRRDDPAHAVQVVPVSLKVRPDADLVEVVTRAMTRVAAHRFDPVLCVDATGGLLGLIRPERMTLRLAELHVPARPGATIEPAAAPAAAPGGEL